MPSIFMRYIIVGAINTGFSYLWFIFFILIGLEYRLASLGALLVGICSGFFAHDRFVFLGGGPGKLYKFISVWIIIYFFNIWGISLLLGIGFNVYFSGLLIAIPAALMAFFLKKMFVFRR